MRGRAGEQARQRGQLEVGGGALFFLKADLFTVFSFFVCLSVRLFPILKYWVQFYVSVQVAVSVAFVCRQPIYNCTDTENEFIVYYGI